jgi:hypothetical protein
MVRIVLFKTSHFKIVLFKFPARNLFNSERVKIPKSTFDRIRRFVDEADDSPPNTDHEVYERTEVHDKRIAPVIEVEFKPIGREYCGTACGLAVPLCKGERRALEQKNSANLSVDVTGNPEAFLVAADEKCRKRLVDDAGIEALKLCGDGRRFLGRREDGLFVRLRRGRTFRHRQP